MTTTGVDMAVAVARLKNLHQPASWQYSAFGNVQLCRECLHRYPWPTIRILGGQT